MQPLPLTTVVRGSVRDDSMALSFGSNRIASSITLEINKTNSQTPLLYRRLVTGTTVGSGGDTGVRLSLAEQLRTQSRLATVAIQNATDGISLVSTADSALESIGDLLSRMAELALQGASTIYSETQTSAFQLEFDALGSEIQRISSTSTFNDLSLLSSGMSLSIQVGITTNSQAAIEIASIVATIAALGLGDGNGTLTYSVSGASSEQTMSASLLAYSAVVQAQNSLLLKRGSLQAASARLSGAVDLMSVVRENYKAAESSISDMDIANDTAELTRLTILQKAQSALLAQANQIPALALKLLE